MVDDKRILQEISRRIKAVEDAALAPSFNLDEYAFDKQKQFIQDPARFKTAVCSRRSGKTIGIAADMISTCLENKDVICLYITMTSKNARSIIWNDIRKIIQDYKIDVKTDDTRLTVKFAKTRSEIRLGGAKDEAEIEKYRGWKLKKAYIDEAQSFRPYLKYFINDILLPALRDLRGSLIITGTPGPIPAGPFYDYATSANLSHHQWTAFENPHMHNPPERDLNVTLAEERLMKGIDENDPGYIRETYGKWIEDLNSLVFKFNKNINITKTVPKNLTYIFGVDIGHDDADAIAVLGYNYDDGKVYLVEELITTKQGITPLSNQLNALKEKYNPVKMVMDAGGLGKKIQAELQPRFGQLLEAADKHRKFEFIELLNDDLRTGKFKAIEGTRFEEDCMLEQWDRSKPGKLAISDTYHSDINMAVLYGWRECKHYFPKEVERKVDKNSNEFMDLMEEREAQEMEDRKTGQSDWGVDAGELESLYDTPSEDYE